jgi:hypothetical protein
MESVEAYRELAAPPALRAHVACVWVSHDAETVGYGPATLVRVQRFQRFLALAGVHPGATLARLAADAGHADQAHLARECRRLSGLAPAALLATGAAPAGERSEAFKPETLVSGRLTA